MYLSLIRTYLLFIAGSILLVSCASRIPPSGGPKDTAPPEVTKVIPENGSTSFAGDLITLDFSEYVQLKDAGSGILVSPPLQIPPLVSLKGKSVQIKFREKLKENTTYTIIIGTSVVDLTEGNALKEYSLVFSTGSVLDSLVLEGLVEDAFSTKPVENALVMLYPEAQDSLPVKTLPLKLARTDAAGKYKISNIREGNYMAFALKDGNKNYKYDLPEEKTGFIDTLLKIAPGVTKPANFRISVNPEQRQRLMNKSFSPPGRIILNYARSVSTWKIVLPDGSTNPAWTPGFVPGTDSLVAWLPRHSEDTLRLFSETVSDEINRTDTLIFRTPNLSQRSRKGGSSPDTSLKFSINLQGGKLIPDDTLRIASTRPLASVDPSRMVLLKEKDTLVFHFPSEPIRNKMGYSMVGLPAEDEKLKLIILPGAFRDVYGATNDTLRWEFREYDEDELGTLSFGLKGTLSSGNWYWELTDKQGKIILRTPYIAEQPFKVPNLIPGIYLVQIYRDENGNRLWDHGNFFRKIQPEQIMHYPTEINVRAGWDLEQTWELGE